MKPGPPLSAADLGLTATTSLDTAADAYDAVERVMRGLGEGLRSRCGHYWHVTPDGLVLAQLWHAPGFDSTAIDAASRSLRVESSHGVLGRALTRHTPAWSTDLSREAYFPRREVVTRASLTTMLAFPVKHHGAMTGVMEFLGVSADAISPASLTELRSIGSRIGETLAMFELRDGTDVVLEGVSARRATRARRATAAQ